MLFTDSFGLLRRGDEVLKDKDRHIDEMQKQLGDNKRQLDAKDAIIESLRKQLAEKS